MKSRVCVICGREFPPAKKSRATTCSRECWRELMRRNAVLPVRPAQKHVRTCENCGKEFVVTGYSVRKTCSAKCKQEQIARKVKKTLLDRYGNLMNKVCPICGREFTCKRFKERKYCSKSCKNRARGRNSETCVVCGRVFFCPASHGGKVCSNDCLKLLLSRNASKQDLSAMREGYRTNPRTASTPENVHAREWSLRAPDGKVYRFKNLNFFIREHRELFPPELLIERRGTPAVANKLSALAPWRREKMRKKSFSWRGWTWAE